MSDQRPQRPPDRAGLQIRRILSTSGKIDPVGVHVIVSSPWPFIVGDHVLIIDRAERLLGRAKCVHLMQPQMRNAKLWYRAMFTITRVNDEAQEA